MKLMKLVNDIRKNITLSEFYILVILSIAIHIPMLVTGQRQFNGVTFWLIHLPAIPIFYWMWKNDKKNKR